MGTHTSRHKPLTEDTDSLIESLNKSIAEEREVMSSPSHKCKKEIKEAMETILSDKQEEAKDKVLGVIIERKKLMTAR